MMVSGSKEEILNLIKARGTLQLDEAVELTDLAKTTLREHFLQLERDGYIIREFVRSGPGRPSLQYSLSQKGQQLFPSQESNMLRDLIQFLKENGNDEEIEQFFTRFWDKRFQRASYLMENEPDQASKLIKLNEMLSEEGFMPEHEINEDKVTIKECNCPFSEVIKETRLPCRLEAEFYEKLFDGPVERTKFIAEGDHSCTYCIKIR
ncbi:helix-turn-helix transcriptional regulator [Rhodohalobacter halophilus]|uniref:helix-turn-helix transcriptional regulator n=1 Tax=Rhodohalobacter halophilus TaxID=1812810 RepID=UPI00083F7FCD|nr:DeoR family transcriptional regulator [Rhodohalobacter halophilus]